MRMIACDHDNENTHGLRPPRSEEEVLGVHGRLRLSGLERDTCLFVVANRQVTTRQLEIVTLSIGLRDWD
jgi:hypothetical protein